ncbi:hypothetical protein [Thermomonospora amylolytica]|uniref:hypothetical protein n=1 Tax=Thermomonospora amylolytica TaxID=1411117 RepID=UPI000E6C89A2|nr:hypothetical protein [Thermomonospora amylolytica]
MINSVGRLGALTAALLLLTAVLAGPAAARERTVPAVSAVQYGQPAVVQPVADDEPRGEAEREEGSGGAARLLTIGSGLLLGIGIGFMFVFMRRGSSSGE